MISQQKMKSWIPEAVERFKAVMPPIDAPYPEFCIVSEQTKEKKRAEIVKLIKSPQKNPGHDAKAELLHGEAGDTIIIYQKNFRENPYVPASEKTDFQHVIWHELGHFYATYAECPNKEFFRYMDQKPRKGEEAQKQIAYWFWTEFIAESIACHVDPYELTADVDWDRVNWYRIKNELGYLLQDAIESEPDTINEYSLSHYYAMLLSNKMTVAFVEAAQANRIRTVKRIVSGVNFNNAETRIDPTGRDTISGKYHSFLDDMETILRKQLSKEKYWEMDSDLLFSIYAVIAELRFVKMEIDHGSFGDLLRRLTQQE